MRLRPVRRCSHPACGHAVGRFVAPLHLLAARCTGVRWWFGCVAWTAGHCVCPGCVPAVVPGPGSSAPCRCPDTAPSPVLV